MSGWPLGRPGGGITTFAYNSRGDLVTVTDAKNQATYFSYDGNRRKISEDRPSVAGTSAARHLITYTYNDNDQLTKEEHHSATGGDSKIINYEYGALGRLTKKTLKSGSIVEDETNYSYENQIDAELLATANNSVAELNFTNGSAPPFAVSSYSIAAAQSGNLLGLMEGSFTIGRDVTGNIASIAGPGGTIYSKKYDPRGRLISVNAGALKTAIEYDSFGRRSKISHSDGTTGSYQYDLLNRISGIQWQENGKRSAEEYLNYDEAGNIVGLARENARYQLRYDRNDQLIQSTMKGMSGVPDYNRSWQYDFLGNRISDSKNGNGNFLNNFLLNNGLSSFEAGSQGMGDVAKEITGQQVKEFTYRADGKIASFKSNDTTVNYFYDGLDRLAAKAVSQNGDQFTHSFAHLSNENRVLLGKAGDGSVTTYIDGQGVNEHLGEVRMGVRKGYITDHLGSVLNSPLTDFDRSYGLFGESTPKVSLSLSSSPTVYGFTGHQVDLETGLIRTIHRQYDSKIGRWFNQDSVGFNGGDVNLYRYVMNRPLTFNEFTCEKAQIIKLKPSTNSAPITI